MHALKALGALTLVLAILAVALIRFSAVESRYRCTGSMVTNQQPQEIEVFLKRQSYRWWVGIWSKSKGSFWLEVPNSTVEYYSNVTGSDILALADSNGVHGTFSTLSNALQVNIPVAGNFIGVCQPIPADA